MVRVRLIHSLFACALVALLALVLRPQPAAPRPLKVCREVCREAIRACVTAGNRACRRTFLRRCKAEGSAACLASTPREAPVTAFSADDVLPNSALPDLVPVISSVSVQRNTTVAAGDVAEGCAERRSGVDLLRFSVTSKNIGRGDVHLGNPGCPLPCSAHPLAHCSNPLFVCSPAQGHNHAHYINFARYEVLNSRNETVVVGHKQGFCLRDTNCGSPKYTCTNQGISAGCSDVYSSTLGCQYIDITGVPRGTYTLRVTLNPLHRIAESSYGNDVTTVPVVLR